MRLAVVGSRDFSNKRLMDDELRKFMPIANVISGGARGADRLAEQWARHNGIEPVVFYPDHKKYRHPYHHRNRLIAEACDHLVAFWNGHSTGTKYTIDYARRIGKPVTVIRG
jgi:predicted Rossmann fold nucleotide-binding protein DprA/Smf involved in DNA uptake